MTDFTDELKTRALGCIVRIADGAIDDSILDAPEEEPEDLAKTAEEFREAARKTSDPFVFDMLHRAAERLDRERRHEEEREGRDCLSVALHGVRR